MPPSRSRTLARVAGAAVASLVVFGSATATFAQSGQAADARRQAYADAAASYGVPASVLLGVSYLESGWDTNAGLPSTSAGFGPMHLTDAAYVASLPLPDAPVDAAAVLDARGDDARPAAPAAPATTQAVPTDPAAQTVQAAVALTGLDAAALRSDPSANIRGGAALLASYQRDLGAPLSADPMQWYGAVAKYAGATDADGAQSFADEVFDVMKNGASRVTDDGHTLFVPPTPGQPDRSRLDQLGLHWLPRPDKLECPNDVSCEWVPAPYQQLSADPGDYGNHDLSDRPHVGQIDYIVIHDTEGTWDGTINLVKDPTYLGWHYTVRSSDGHIDQHIQTKDVGWHAGNWDVNARSIGIEHEGFAAQGATWYTESLYESSAALVRHLAHEYGVPLDRAHIIGHDQVPGIDPAHVAGMHWDPGPYWDWEHYMALLRHPIRGDKHADGRVVIVKPGFDGNEQPVTGCGPDGTCPAQGTNFVYLHQSPSDDSPLVTDIGLHPEGMPTTTNVSDIGARAAAGQKLAVAERSGDWVGVWWLGEEGWIHDPASQPAVTPSSGRVATAAGDHAVPVYGRAYPEKSAYPSQIPYQTVVPLQYSIQPGQAYALADTQIQTDYYYAKTFRCSGLPMDCTDVVGQDRYYEIWFGHRVAYVRAADVTVSRHQGP